VARFLFTTWEGGGHVQPMLLVAQGLREMGHDALVISDACNASDAAAVGLAFRSWRRAPSRSDRSPDSDPLKDWLAKSPLEVIQGILQGVMSGPAAAYGADVAEAIDEIRPDVVVTQELLFGAMAAAEAKKRPLAVLTGNLWSLPTLPDAPPFGGGLPPARGDEERHAHKRVSGLTRQVFQSGLPGFNAARASLGLAPLADLFDQLAVARRILIATSRAFDFQQSPPDPYRYVGPYLADPAWTDAFTPPWPEGDRRPLVLVSFSTMYQRQEDALKRVIKALGALPVRGVVTLGPVLSPRDFPAPENVSVMAKAPHAQILPLASAVVTHGGHATVLRPLLAGLPLVCLPLGRDQPDNVVRVTERFAGLRLAADASVSEIEIAIRTVLNEGQFREAAKSLGARIQADVETRSAERELLALAEG
jgi:MGT family glycosyltransferase